MRKSSKPAIVAVAFAAAAAGTALADDNGMTAGYGDSWANLQAQNPAAATTPSYMNRSTVVTTPRETIVTTPGAATVVSPSDAVTVVPVPAPATETELNTGHYIDSNGNPVVPSAVDSNGNPVVPPANVRPAP